ncbi:uncharacterized protein LOC117645151 [Thrips palmi]|uniref:Uncharacterized protein LOC117645151 n=1 Tax=Thrips palmi TaxID=161013 RepID=A0A6P8Z370_THRPL|nr:uncharacterized protein LOC117645151 [Thrips palmi]
MQRALPALLGALCVLAAAPGGSGGGTGGGSGGGPGAAPPGPVVINPSANVFLGAVVALRSRGAGLFGCGPRTREGLATLDAVQALVDAVNNDQPGYPSIPKGVSLGVRVFDHCGRPRVAVSQLAELLPELGPGGPPPAGTPATTAAAATPGLRTVGILDGAGLTRTDSDADLEVRHALAESMVPVAAVDSSHLVQPLQRAQAMVAVLQKLEWRRFVVVRGPDAYSEDLWQSLAQLAGGLRTADFCVDSVETFVHEGHGPAASTSDVMDVVADAAVAGLPVVVLLPRAALRPFLEALREAEADMPPAAPAALMLLLSDLVSHEDAALLPRGATVYSLATSGHGPEAAKALRALLPAEEAVDTDSLTGSLTGSLTEALRADALLAAAQPVLAFALALKRSWRDKCPGKQSGACPPWAAMSRPEFLNAYFAPVAAAIGRGEKVQDGAWEPRWAELLLPPRDLTLYRHHAEDADDGRLDRHRVRPVLRASSVDVNYNNSVASRSSVTVLDDDFHPEEIGVCATRPSVPSPSECERSCLPLHRPSRTGGGRRIESWAHYQDNHLQRDAVPEEAAEVLDAEAEAESRDFLRLLESPQRVYVALLVALHRGRGDSALDCAAGDEALDVVAVRKVEAFLWAVQRLNQQLAREASAPNGQQLQVGALLADTCSSKLRAMALAARLRTASRGADDDADDTRSERVLAVVNALPLPAARLAADILSERNVTSIATEQVLHANASAASPFQLQVDLPLAQMVEAMVQSLQQLGWSYVSVVQADGQPGDDGDLADHARGRQMFLEAAARAGICVALDVALPAEAPAADRVPDDREEAVVARLLGARAAGARGVVVWADAGGVRRLFRAVTRAIAQGSLRREDVFWMLASTKADVRDVLAEFGNVLAGAAVFSPQRRGVAEFQHFLRLETSSSGGSGGVTGSDHELRWLRRYQEQCGGGSVCLADEAGAVAADWAVVQAVQALGAVVSHLGQAAPCPSDRPWTDGGDVCLPDAAPKALDAAVADALRTTPSSRADGPVGAEFRFSPDGVGLLAVDVDNFRRRAAAARSRSLGDVHFQRVGTFFLGRLTPLDGRDADADGLVAYKDSGEEVRVAALTSQCGGALGSCHRCRHQRGRPNSALGDWIVVEPQAQGPHGGALQAKEPTVYVVATLDVHEPSNNPLQCGQEINPRGVEQLEAFLWAVDQVNSNYSGLRVGAVVIDTCGSAARTARLVSEVLSDPTALSAMAEQAEPGSEAAGAGAVVAVLAGGGTPVAAPALEAAAALGLPSVAPLARGPPLHRKTLPPYPLQLGPSNGVLANTTVKLMAHLQWRCAAAVYLQDAVDYEETYRQVESQALAANISLVGVPVPASARNHGGSGVLRQALLRVAAARDGGRAAVLLFLPAWGVDGVLRATAALEDEGKWVPEDVTLVSVGGDGEAAFVAASRQTLGGLLLRPKAGAVPEFERHFRTLTPDANDRNPWFAEFWSGVFHCRGAACSRAAPHGPKHSLDAYQMQRNADTPNVINAVLAVGHALQTVRRELCPDGGAQSISRSPCRAMAAMSRVRARLLEVTPRMAFVGAGLNAVAFSAAGENTNVAVEVLNVQVSAHSKAAVAMTVAEVAPAGAVAYLEGARAYVGPQRQPVDLPSAAPACAADTTTAAPTTTTTPTPVDSASRYLMELPGVGAAGQPAPALLVLLAAHTPARQGGPLHCGDLDADALCHLAGVMFAVHRANNNDSLLQGQGPKLGLIALDTCGQPGRAYSSLFALLSRPNRGAVPVAALLMDDAAPAMVAPLLDMESIAQLSDPGSDGQLQREGQRHVVVQAAPEALSRALLDVAVALQGHQGHAGPQAEARSAPDGAAEALTAPSLVVLHGSTPRARTLARHLESGSLARCPSHDHHTTAPGCLSAVLPMPATSDNSRSGAVYLLSTQAAHSVVILALDSVDDVRAVLAAAQSPLVPRLVFVTALPAATPLRADGHSVLSLVADATVVAATPPPRDEAADKLDAAFQQWLNHDLGDAATPTSMPPSWASSFRSSPCDLDHDHWSRADIMNAVERVARGVRWAADNATTASSSESAAKLSARVARFLEAEDERPDGEAATASPTSPPQVESFRIWRGDEPLGSWSPDGGLTLSNDPSLLAVDELSVTGRPTLFHNLQYAWAVALLGLALLGIVFTLVTAVFFLSAAAVSKTPISGGAGTSVLGYLILLGLLLLHCAVLALVMAPSELSCGARRLLPGLAYALIFSAMFLKVLTTWQVCDRKGGVVRPVMLVVRALGLATPQVLVSAGWLALAPPSVHMVVVEAAAAPAAPAMWQCSAAQGAHGSQAPHLLLSLAYTCLLMVATAVLALLCSSKEELLEEGTMLRQESRWILVSAVAVAVQLGCWGLLVVAAPALAAAVPAQADMLAASVHALAAATLLLCLFVPKLRLYLRLRRDARNTAAIAASAAARSAASRSQPIYGISHFQPFGGKLNPAFDAPSTDMSLGESASRTASDRGSDSEAEGDYNEPMDPLESMSPLSPLGTVGTVGTVNRLDPTQVVPSSLYSIDMFSSQDSSSQGVLDMPGPVVVAMSTSDGRGTVRGTVRGAHPHNPHQHASVFGTVRGVHGLHGLQGPHGVHGGTLRSAHGGTLRGVQALVQGVQGGTVRGAPRGTLQSLHGTIRGSHFLPGSNEFTAPHRSSSMLLLPGQESISYM